MDNNRQITISAFEFAIMSIADPEEAKKYRARTPKEEIEYRENNIRTQASRLKLKK